MSVTTDLVCNIFVFVCYVQVYDSNNYIYLCTIYVYEVYKAIYLTAMFISSYYDLSLCFGIFGYLFLIMFIYVVCSKPEEL